MTRAIPAAAALVCALAPRVLSAADQGWVLERPCEGVLVLRNESAKWGEPKLRVAHLNDPSCQVRKILDLSGPAEAARARAKSARLRLFFAIQDYSWNMAGRQHNGLNEAFEVVVNGHAQRFETRDPRFASRAAKEQRFTHAWTDLPIRVQDLRPGPNEVILRKLPGTGDDFLYPGIDNTVARGCSATSFDGGRTWHTDRLNANAAKGEFMIRLVLVETPSAAALVWRPPDALEDAGGLAAYAGRDRETWVLELSAGVMDPMQGLAATVAHQGPAPSVEWRDEGDQPLDARLESGQGQATASLPPQRTAAAVLVVRPAAGTTVSEIRVAYAPAVTAPKPVVDMRPEVAPPRGPPRYCPPRCSLAPGRATLENSGLRAVFGIDGKLALLSLYAAEIDRNVLARPAETHLFRLRLADKTYGCADCTITDVESTDTGFTAALRVADTGLEARLKASIDDDELRLAFEVVNAGDAPVDFHLAFPHLAGIELSETPARDYYLFPLYGGAIANVDASLISAYGGNHCWWQMIDLFSPERGGGVYLRCDDPTALFKWAALRKGKDVGADYTIGPRPRAARMRPDMAWHDALAPDPGIGVAFEYVRRTRAPGERFRPPPACIGSHAGDWRPALEQYAEWAHDTWPPRPYPSALTRRWHMGTAGWGAKHLLHDEKGYRLDRVAPCIGVLELMSWWDWSELGPWDTPIDKVREQCGEAFYQFRKWCFVKEPVSGRMMYTKNRGDYVIGPQWGGLEPLRRYIADIRGLDVLPTFYVEGVLACSTTRLAKRHAKQYAVMDPSWANPYNQHYCPRVPEGYVGQWASYNMCSDTEFWAEHLARTVARVCRDTGIDGLRLDEYGHHGWVCSNPNHEHVFAEPGHNAWLQATARVCRLVHEKMDEVRPGLVLTTEYPGADHLAAALDGALFHEAASSHVSAVRPVPCNLFRFYFRHCKPFDISRPAGKHAKAWNLFNATATYASAGRHAPGTYTMLVENTDAFEGERIEPLTPTLVPRVYANRFEGGGKTFFTLFNAAGHTVDAPVLPAAPDPDRHYVDPLSGAELTPVRVADGWALRLRIKRNRAAVAARLPKRLTVADGAVRASGDATGMRIVAAARTGMELASFENGDALTPPQTERPPIMLKLLRDGLLVDATAWPR